MMPSKVGFPDIYEEALRRAMRPRYPKRVRLGTPEEKIDYPSSDGRMMAETSMHRETMMYCIRSVKQILKDQTDAYVSGNTFIYYEKGDPRKRVSPDCYVIFSITHKPKYERDSFKVWDEQNQLPSFVFEVTSKYTRPEDEELKRPLYEQWGVQEYVCFDLLGDYLHPTLQGSRLVNGNYLPIDTVNGRLHSQVLNLDFYDEGKNLRIVDMRHAKSKVMLTYQEQIEVSNWEAQRADAEAERANAEAEARVAAEQEVARLRAALEAALAGQSPGGGKNP